MVLTVRVASPQGMRVLPSILARSPTGGRRLSDGDRLRAGALGGGRDCRRPRRRARVRLVLPETGVCSAAPVAAAAAAGCCGGPAPAEVRACCVLDAEAKSAGKAGCGCSSAVPEVASATRACSAEAAVHCSARTGTRPPQRAACLEENAPGLSIVQPDGRVDRKRHHYCPIIAYRCSENAKDSVYAASACARDDEPIVPRHSLPPGPILPLRRQPRDRPGRTLIAHCG